MGFITDLLKDIPLSAVLKERLADTEKEMATLRDENVSLTAEIARLKQKTISLESENLNLKQTIYQFQSQPSTLSELEHSILNLFKKYLRITLDVVHNEISLDEIKAEYFLNELLKKKLLTIEYEREPNKRKPRKLYVPTQDGRAYIIENKII